MIESICLKWLITDKALILLHKCTYVMCMSKNTWHLHHKKGFIDFFESGGIIFSGKCVCLPCSRWNWIEIFYCKNNADQGLIPARKSSGTKWEIFVICDILKSPLVSKLMWTVLIECYRYIRSANFPDGELEKLAAVRTLSFFECAAAYTTLTISVSASHHSYCGCIYWLIYKVNQLV